MAPTCLSVTIYQIALHSISKFHFCLPHIFRISVELLICWDNDDNNRKMYNGLPCSSLEWLIFRLRIRCGSIVFPYMFTMQSFIAYLVCVCVNLFAIYLLSRTHKMVVRIFLSHIGVNHWAQSDRHWHPSRKKNHNGNLYEASTDKINVRSWFDPHKKMNWR